MPEVSFIVPVYNAEAALERLIESVLSQEYRDLELILMDDGSKDGSGAIMDQYAADDPRVIAVHKTNSGVSDTRNQGLKKATGKYIRFLDADDWIPDDSTKQMVRAAEETGADLVVGDFYRVVGENVSRKGSIASEKPLSRNEYAEWMMESPADYYYGVIWNKLYRKEILDRYHLEFDKDLSFCEDFVFNLEYLLHTDEVIPIQVPVYYYVKTEGSLVSKNMNPVRIARMKTSIYTYYNDFYKNILDEEQYRSQRANIAGFLIAAAQDDLVVPMMPGTMKLGEEVIPAYVFSENEKDLYVGLSYLSDAYARYLNTAAIRRDLSLNDMRILNFMKHAGKSFTHREIAGALRISQLDVMASLQKMALRNLVKVEVHGEGLLAEYIGSAEIEKDMDEAMQDLSEVCTDTMTEEEKEQFRLLFRKMCTGLREHLK